jgi:hypothetical protein
MSKTTKRCQGGCSFWTCGRPEGHPGPCQPAESAEDRRFREKQRARVMVNRALRNEAAVETT